MIKNSNSKRYVSKFYIFIIIFSFIIFIKTIVYQVRERHRLSLQIETLEENKHKLNKEIETIKSDLKDVDNEDFIRRVAREKLKMVDKNEVVVKYKD